MKGRYSFTATRKQWKNQLSKWNLNKKNVKPAEYRAMMIKKREREDKDPTKATQFILHGFEVPADKIARFESREGRNKGLNGLQGDALTPPGLLCQTPPINQDSGDKRKNTIIKMPIADYAMSSDNLSSVQPQVAPNDLAVAIQTIEPPLSVRSPSLEHFDWFEKYINYSESVHATPVTSVNPLKDMLMRSQRVLDSYENERAYQSFSEGLRLKHSCNKCKLLGTFLALQEVLGSENKNMTPIQIEDWAQVTVGKAIQAKKTPHSFMAVVGEAIGNLYIALGRKWKAKLYLEKEITLSLARCYFELGRIQKAENLLKVLFQTEYSIIVASSYLRLEDYCKSCEVRLLREYHFKTMGGMAQGMNDIERYGWEEYAEFFAYEWESDEVELKIRVIAAALIRRFIPGVAEEVRGCDDDSSGCIGPANDAVDGSIRPHEY